MVTGRLPFDDDNIQRLLMKVQAGQFHMPQELPKDLQNIIHAMLTVDPVERITLEEIKAHPWFNTFTPRFYPVDTFEAPSEPVLSPDPRVLASLSDLGWGDVEAIAEKLALVGRSMEKVFYGQLSRHRMFNKPHSLATGASFVPAVIPPASLPCDSSPVHLGQASSGPTDLKRPAVGANDEGTNNLEGQVSDLSVAENRDSASRMSSSASWPGVVDPSSRLEVQRADHGAESSGSTPATGNLSHGLVRQSKLLRSATDYGEKAEDDTIETAIDGGEHKSWFDSVRDMWSWQGKEPDNFGHDKDGNVEGSNKTVIPVPGASSST
jgi:serine/threonine protein kinase